jgi:hypothetical protein
MKNKKTKFLINEVNLFYIKMNASKHTVEYISEKLGCDCSDIVDIYNDSKKSETNLELGGAKLLANFSE